MSNGSSTGTGLRPMPGKIGEVIAFSCTSAGVERGSQRGHPALARKGEGGRDRGLGVDLGAQLIEHGAPFDADGRDRRCPEFLGDAPATIAAGKSSKQKAASQRASEADSLGTQCVAPGALPAVGSSA